VTFLIVEAGIDDAADVVRPLALVVTPLAVPGFSLAAVQERHQHQQATTG
jgi:hypothetical protein